MKQIDHLGLEADLVVGILTADVFIVGDHPGLYPVGGDVTDAVELADFLQGEPGGVVPVVEMHCTFSYGEPELLSEGNGGDCFHENMVVDELSEVLSQTELSLFA